jgi:flagellar hook-associated protein 1 FlgK
MSGSGLFGIARSALLSHQTALQTISHNIANAETPGYSRQEALLTSNTPVLMPFGSVGTGVSVNTILRRRDVLLDDNFRSTNSSASYSEMHRDLLSRVEQMFGEPSDAGMSAALDQFFNAWSELATSPSNTAAQGVVQQRGRQIAQLFNDYDTQLTQQRNSAIDRLTSSVAEINSLAVRVADLNQQITSSEAGGHAASDLRDQRDLILDRLSQVAGARTITQKDGTISVIVGTSTLVDNTTARPLTVEMIPQTPPPAVPTPDVPLRIRLGTSPDALAPLGGELKALIQHLNTEIPALRSQLDALASGLASAVNAEHVQNFLFNGNAIPGTAAGNFFDPGSVAAPVRASSLKLSAAVAADAGAIAASRDANAPLDNTGAHALSDLRSLMTAVSYVNPAGVTQTGSFVGFFRDVVSRLGLDVRTADDDATVQRVMADQANVRRESVSGVNTDEELVQMLRVQQAYTAATKLIKAADEMLESLLMLV